MDLQSHYPKIHTKLLDSDHHTQWPNKNNYNTTIEIQSGEKKTKKMKGKKKKKKLNKGRKRNGKKKRKEESDLRCNVLHTDVLPELPVKNHL